MSKIVVPSNPDKLLQRALNNPDVKKENRPLGESGRVDSPFAAPYEGYKTNKGIYMPNNTGEDLYRNTKAMEQTTGDYVLGGLGHAGGTLVGELSKIVPLLAGSAVALGGNILSGDIDLFDNFLGMGTDEDNFDGTAWINNKIVQGIDEIEKNALKDLIITNTEYDKLGWSKKIGTPEFWATQGGDGVGFMISMFTPGALAKMANVGGWLGKGAGALGKASEAIEAGEAAAAFMAKNEGTLLAGMSEEAKIFQASLELGKSTEAIKQGLSMLAKKGAYEATKNSLIKYSRWMKPAWAIDETGTTAAAKWGGDGAANFFNSYVESASEANDTRNTVKESLKANQSINGLSDEEIDKRAGNAAASVMTMNMPLLLFSNAILDNVILDGLSSKLNIGTRSAGRAERDVLGLMKKYAAKESDESLISFIKANVKPVTAGSLAKSTAYKMGLGVLKEGLFEEGSQTSIQTYSKKMAELGLNPGMLESFAGAAQQWASSVTDKGDNDFWESVVLGAALGGLGEAGVMSNAKIAVNGGISNIDYNRRLFGGEARKGPKNFIERVMGVEAKPKTEGVISTVEQLLKHGFESANPKDYFEMEASGVIKLDENGKPTVRKDKTDSFMVGAALTKLEIDNLDTKIEAMKAEKAQLINQPNEIQEISQFDIDAEIEVHEAKKKILQDMTYYNHFSKLFEMGALSKDLTDTVIKNLVQRQKEKIQGENAALSEQAITKQLESYKDEMTKNMERYEKIYNKKKEVTKRDLYYKPNKDNILDYLEWTKREDASVLAHLFHRDAMESTISSLNTKLSKLDEVQDQFRELEKVLSNIYNETEGEEITPYLKRLKEIAPNISGVEDIKTLAEKATDDFFRQKAKAQWESFDGTPVSKANPEDGMYDEESYTEDYLKKQKEALVVTGKGASRETSNESYYDKKRKDQELLIKMDLLTKLSKKENLQQLLPAFVDSAKTIKYLSEGRSGVDSLDKVSSLDKTKKGIERNIEALQQEMNTSEVYYNNSANAMFTEDRFNKYLENKRKLKENKIKGNTHLNNLVSMLNDSDYISKADFENYNKLKNLNNRTSEEQETLDNLEKTLLTSEGKLRNWNYEVRDNQLFVNPDNKAGLLITIKDLYSITEKIKDAGQRREFRSLLKKEVLSDEEQITYDKYMSMLDDIDVKLISEEWTPYATDANGKTVYDPVLNEEGNATTDSVTGEPIMKPRLSDKKVFKTKVMLIKDAGLGVSLSELSYYNEKERKFIAYGLNNRSFFEHYRASKVIEVTDPIRKSYADKFNYYLRLKSRLARIREGNRLATNTLKKMDEVRDNMEMINTILLPMLNSTILDGNIDELNLETFLSEMETKSGDKDIKATYSYLKELDKLAKDEYSLTLKQVQERILDTDEYATVKREIINQIVAISNSSLDAKLSIALNTARTDLTKSLRRNYQTKYLILNLNRIYKEVANKPIIENGKTSKLIMTEELKGQLLLKMMELLDSTVKDYQSDVNNGQKVVDWLREEASLWKSEEFDVKERYKEMINKYSESSKYLSDINLNASIPSVPEYLNQITARQKAIEKLIDKIEKYGEKSKSTQIVLEEVQEKLLHLTSLLGKVSEKRDAIARDFKVSNELNELDKQLAYLNSEIEADQAVYDDNNKKGIIKDLESISKAMSSIETLGKDLVEDYINNNLYKSLYSRYGAISKLDYAHNSEKDIKEGLELPIVSSAISDLFTFSTNDVVYTSDFKANKDGTKTILRYEDKLVYSEYEGRKMLVPEMREEEGQQAFQNFIANSNTLFSENVLVTFGVPYLLAMNTLNFDTDTYSIGTVPAEMESSREVLELIVDKLNEYIHRDKEGQEDRIRMSKETLYTVPFNTKSNVYYKNGNDLAITAMMHPDNRFKVNLQKDALYKYLNTHDGLWNEVKDIIGGLVKTTKNRKGEATKYIDKKNFLELIKNKEAFEAILKVVKADYTRQYQSMTSSASQSYKITTFSKGFRYRVRDAATRETFYRNYTPEEVSNIKLQVIQDLGDRKVTSKAFFQEKYYGLVSATHTDGSEELVKIRTVSQKEAETVAGLLYYRFLNKGAKESTIEGSYIFPFEESEKEWDKGLISSIIRYGTTQDYVDTKMKNSALASKKKKSQIKNNQARPYDIWVEKRDSEEIVKWVEGDGRENFMPLADILKIENGEVMFNSTLIAFLQTKKFNVSSYINREKKAKALFYPVFNPEGLQNSRIPMFERKQIDNIKRFYILGNKELGVEPAVQTSSLPDKPTVVGRTVSFNPTSKKVFEFNTVNKKTEAKTKDASLEGYEEVKGKKKINELPDGDYKVEVKGNVNQVFSVEVRDGRLVTEDINSGLDTSYYAKVIEENKDVLTGGKGISISGTMDTKSKEDTEKKATEQLTILSNILDAINKLKAFPQFNSQIRNQFNSLRESVIELGKDVNLASNPSYKGLSELFPLYMKSKEISDLDLEMSKIRDILLDSEKSLETILAQNAYIIYKKKEIKSEEKAPETKTETKKEEVTPEIPTPENVAFQDLESESKKLASQRYKEELTEDQKERLKGIDSGSFMGNSITEGTPYSFDYENDSHMEMAAYLLEPSNSKVLLAFLDILESAKKESKPETTKAPSRFEKQAKEENSKTEEKAEKVDDAKEETKEQESIKVSEVDNTSVNTLTILQTLNNATNLSEEALLKELLDDAGKLEIFLNKVNESKTILDRDIIKSYKVVGKRKDTYNLEGLKKYLEDQVKTNC